MSTKAGTLQSSNAENEQSQSADSGTEGGVEGRINFPGFSAGAHTGVELGKKILLRQLGGNRTVSEFVYSQAHYLHEVRSEPHRRELVRSVRGLSDAQDPRSGTFVEYEAKFSSDQLSAILDVLTPDLVAEALRFF